MEIRAEAVDLDEIRSWRDTYRREMGCQIIHDSIHTRHGWTREFVLSAERVVVGYGSVAVAGPWAVEPTVYEFFVTPPHRSRAIELFRALLDASGAGFIEVQSNDLLATAMLHACARDVTECSILFHDNLTTSHAPLGAMFREPSAEEAPDIPEEHLRWNGVVEIDGRIAATGGILFHYNPPYGDIHMEVSKPFRRRGLGAFIVQELKRVCYSGGHIPSARCNPANVASHRTLQKAGFVPCGHMLRGSTIGLSQDHERISTYT
jgi:GNAT superfamily N-acetyltransferase